MQVILQADERPKQNHKDAILPALPQELYLFGEKTWTDIEPQDYSPTDDPVSKKLTTLLRHRSLPRKDNGAIEYWRLKDHLRNHFVHSQHWSDEKWKSTMAKGGGNKKRCQYCTDPSGEILYFRALQGHFRTQPH